MGKSHDKSAQNAGSCKQNNRQVADVSPVVVAEQMIHPLDALRTTPAPVISAIRKQEA